MQQARVLELEMSIRHSEPRAFWRRFQEKGATHFLAAELAFEDDTEGLHSQEIS